MILKETLKKFYLLYVICISHILTMMSIDGLTLGRFIALTISIIDLIAWIAYSVFIEKAEQEEKDSETNQKQEN